MYLKSKLEILFGIHLVLHQEWLRSEVHSEHSQISKMEFFAKIING